MTESKLFWCCLVSCFRMFSKLFVKFSIYKTFVCTHVCTFVENFHFFLIIKFFSLVVLLAFSITFPSCKSSLNPFRILGEHCMISHEEIQKKFISMRFMIKQNKMKLMRTNRDTVLCGRKICPMPLKITRY